jgi:hypothetical protein
MKPHEPFSEGMTTLATWVPKQVANEACEEAKRRDITVSKYLRRLLTRDLAKRPRRVVRGTGDGEMRTP